jgi:histone acetyltransferase
MCFISTDSASFGFPSTSDGEDDQPLAAFVSPNLQNGKSHGAPLLKNGNESSFKKQQRSAFASKPPLRSAGEVGSSRPEKPCIGELRKGIIRVIAVDLDHTPRSLIVLCGLKTLFRKQLPKMPPEYISRLVYDYNSRALAIVKAGWKVVGGILFRPFPQRGFAEIVFFATASVDQIKVFSNPS